MQKIAFKVLLLSMTIAFISCDNGEENGDPFFQIEKTSVDIRESGLFNREIPLSTNITKFEITVAETGKDEAGEYWCSAKVKNNMLVITCEENKIYDPRETDITVKPEGAKPVQIHVRQLGQVPIILVSPKTEYSVSFLEETIELDVTSNVEYAVILPEWIKGGPLGRAPETVTNGYRLIVSLNEASTERVDTIYFKQKDVEEEKAKIAKVIVKQAANMPPPVSNVAAKSVISADDVASITISWSPFAEESKVKAIELSYTDPATGTNVLKTLDPNVTEYKVDNTFKKYGEYEFSIRGINIFDNPGNPVVIKITSKRVPHVPGAVTGDTKLNLVGKPLSTNAPEPNEGPIANLVDGNTSSNSFFHTQWSGTVPPGPHWAQINMGTELSDHFRIKLTARNNKNIPVDFDLQGSHDGKEWFLIKNFTKDADKLTIGGNADPFTSPEYRIINPFSYIRISVNATSNNEVCWSMSEFEIWDVKTEVISDPEAIN